MSYPLLVWAAALRNPTRTILTGICLAIAFLLFGLLQPVSQIFAEGPQTSSIGRLVVIPKHSTSDLLPVSYLDQIQRVDGVVSVSHQTWFGGTYLDPANYFPQFAVTPAGYLEVIKEIRLPQHQRAAFVSSRQAAIVGRETAEKYGWSIGQQISLIPNIWHNRDGGSWEFKLVGIFDSSDTSIINNTGFYFGYDYFDSYRAFGNGRIGSLVLRIAHPSQMAEIANSIDRLFANSSAETKTLSDREYALSFAKQMGNVGLIVTAILGAVFFTILLLAGNTMAQATRERIPELAVMKVLGFQSKTLLWIVLAESILLTTTAAVVGLVTAKVLLSQLDELLPQLGQIGLLGLPLDIAVLGLLIALAIGFLVGFPPALKAMRLNIVDALRI